MTDERRIAERRRLIRRAPEARAPEQAPSQALVPVAPPEPAPDDVRSFEAKPRRGGFAGFAAQMLGQGGQKRGLRGGPETLDRARSTYLETEWSGPADRRPHPGRITKTEI